MDTLSPNNTQTLEGFRPYQTSCCESLNNIVNDLAIRADDFCDYIPFLSTATTIINIFQKCVILPILNLCSSKKGLYYTNLENKSMTRCLWLLIPIIGNILSKVLKTMDYYGRDDGYDSHHAIGNSFEIAFFYTVGILGHKDFNHNSHPGRDVGGS